MMCLENELSQIKMIPKRGLYKETTRTIINWQYASSWDLDLLDACLV